jgi:hypothetical protein
MLYSFNKNEDEFASKQEYDDYLEEREDISESFANPATKLPLHLNKPQLHPLSTTLLR